GDPPKPKLVFFFDEAHLLFDDTPRALLEKIEVVVRLIRSKGVGVYFVTQNPLDLPQTVLGQLGNRVQHALRAFTPRDQKAVRAAAETFRTSGELDVARVISELGVGEALISTLDEKGMPNVVERALVYPPASRIAPLSVEERRRVVERSMVYGYYERMIDRESAYEKLRERLPVQGESVERELPAGGARRTPARSQSGDLFGAFAKSAAHAIGSQIGRQIIRGVLGSLFGGRR
ncbi:MAG: DUF853 family protein, partial [Deltaproteobacteria bacterium]|nr:DUF853 family protein [Deltaproteobacteria bacterium]